MAVATNTIRTTSWDVIYTYLQTTNPISTSNIFSSKNSKLVATSGYPIVIISPPNASFTKLSLAGDYITSDLSIMIEVYDDNAQDTKALADEVTAKLLAGRLTFAQNRLKNMEIDGGDYDTWEDGSKRIHKITFNVSFRFIDDVRA